MLLLQMLDPVVSMCQLQSQIKSRRCLQRPTGAASEGDAGKSPRKRAKISSSSSSNNLLALRSSTGHGLDVVQKNGFCDDTDTARHSTCPEESKVTNSLFKYLLLFGTCNIGGTRGCIDTSYMHGHGSNMNRKGVKYIFKHRH